MFIQRGIERMWTGEGQRERERESQVGSGTVSAEPDAGLHLNER